MSVFILNGDSLYEKMWRKEGFEVVHSLEKASIVQFTGGEDVTPSLYGHRAHPSSYFNTIRDEEEKKVFNICLSRDIPMVGVCRGAQFLNVMSGGELYQDVDGHTRPHYILDIETGEEVLVSSTHHQMMIQGTGGNLLAYATEDKRKTKWNGEKFEDVYSSVDPEVILYPLTCCLCFQPHPEYSVVQPEFEDMKDYYFKLIKEWLL